MNKNSGIDRGLALAAVEKAIFIIGTMRSGTGLLGLQINESRNVVGCPFELRGIWTQIGKVSMASGMHGRYCPELDESFLSEVPVTVLKEAFALEVERNIGEKPWSSKLRFLNKNPHLCNKIYLVAKIFPQALFIWTLRDLDSVVVSLKNLFEREEMIKKNITHVWPEGNGKGSARCFSVFDNGSINSSISAKRCFPGGDVTYLAEYWLECNLALLKFHQQFGSNRITLIHQKKVLTQPSLVAKQLRKFIGLGDDELTKISHGVNHNEVGQWKSLLTITEENKLCEFREQHSEEIAEINALVAEYGN